MMSSLFIFVVRCYQKFISPLFGARCRFYPSCSQYAILAVKKYGFFKGVLKACYRILRCNPWNPGGIDYP